MFQLKSNKCKMSPGFEPKANLIKLFWCKFKITFSCKNRPFLNVSRLGWKGLQGTNTLAYYEKLRTKKVYNIGPGYIILKNFVVYLLFVS